MHFNAVKNQEHKFYQHGQLDMCMCQDPSCSWSIGHRSSFVGVLVSVFLNVSIFPECRDSLEAISPLVSLPFFPLFYQCYGCLFFFSPSTWGLMAGLPGFANHGSGLHLGAGCQWWKLLDVSGTQPPLCEAVVNHLLRRPSLYLSLYKQNLLTQFFSKSLDDTCLILLHPRSRIFSFGNCSWYKMEKESSCSCGTYIGLRKKKLNLS